MPEARLETTGDGHLSLSGQLSFDTVPGLWDRWRSLAGGRPAVDVDLAGVHRADSAGLALLVACMRFARQTGQQLRFCNIPTQMLDMARVSGLEDMLPLHRDA